ncbi:MAG: beta-ketoacyl synthase N-terminal-like domain-containing protein, partial [Planctomycetota bacterium]
MEGSAARAPIAIVGIACLFPQARDVSSYWANIKGGVDAITAIPPSHWRPEEYLDPDPSCPDRVYVARGGFLPEVGFPALEYGIPPNALEATDTSQLLGLLVAEEALRDAGYGREGRAFDRSRVSVLLGVTGTLELVIPLGARLGHPIWRQALREAGVEGEIAEQVVRRIGEGYVEWQEDSFPGLLGNVVAGRIANRLDLGGTNSVVDAACASSLGALHLAEMELASGRADMVLSGGVDSFNDIFMYMCFSKTPALSPGGDARPFDRGGDGTILGEGIGILILKRVADARRDGDRIYALVSGIGTSSDGRGTAIYAPSAAGQARALRGAYERAGVAPDSVELLEAHGTGTAVGDAVELSALTEVYREARADGTWCALGSVKSQIGHTKAAAGVAGLIKAALALHHKVLPPTIKVEDPLDPLASGDTPFYLNTSSRPWLSRAAHPRRAAVSSFGFGGSNFHCVLEEAEPRKGAPDWDGRVQILAFSAAERGSLEEKVEAARTAIAGMNAWVETRVAAARARAAFRPEDPERLLVVVDRQRGLESAAGALAEALSLLGADPERQRWMSPGGIFYGRGPAPGKLGLLFPGQGAQYPGMLRDLACLFPRFLEILEEADRAFWEGEEARGSARLSDMILPPRAFTEERRGADERALRSTRVAQPAIGAVSLGALRLLEAFGVVPEACAGHSYGELVALCAAGRLSERALHALSNFRGRLMGAGSGDRGGMLAVEAPIDELAGLLEEEGLDLVLANHNAPRQGVLSGASDEIARATGILTGRGFRVRRLEVAAAFHSPLVADAERPFEKALRRVRIEVGQVPVYANSTALRYADDPGEALWFAFSGDRML